MAKAKTAWDDETRRKSEAWRAKLKHDAEQARKEVEQARVAEGKKTERLRALRLAKEATDKEAADNAPPPVKPVRVRRKRQVSETVSS